MFIEHENLLLTLTSGTFTCMALLNFRRLISLPQLKANSTETCCASHDGAKKFCHEKCLFSLVRYLKSLIILVKLKVNGHFNQDNDRQVIFLFRLHADPQNQKLIVVNGSFLLCIYYLPC